MKRLDLRALLPDQLEALRVVVDGVDEFAQVALDNVHPRSIAAPHVRAVIQLNSTICSAIGRAERAQKKGNR